jgi:hypothetical protein
MIKISKLWEFSSAGMTTNSENSASLKSPKFTRWHSGAFWVAVEVARGFAYADCIQQAACS